MSKSKINITNTTRTWCKVLQNSSFNHNSVVVEIGPGFKSKIGQAFSMMGFNGTYHIIEPNKVALQHSMLEYTKILPHAKIIGHSKPLHEIEIGKDIPEHVSALLGNHIFDDIVLTSAVGGHRANIFFSMNSGVERAEETRKIWDSIEKSIITSSAQKTSNIIIDFIKKTSPGFTALSHYNGATLSLQNINIPNEIGREVAKKISTYFNLKKVNKYEKIFYGALNEPTWVIMNI